MEQIVSNFEIAQVIANPSIAAEFWYGCETCLEIS